MKPRRFPTGAALALLLTSAPLAPLAAETHWTLLNQQPLGFNEFLVPSDETCDGCPGPDGSSVAIAGSKGADGESYFDVLDELVVWGVYAPGPAPPTEDSFTVIVHQWGFPESTPGPAICTFTGLAGTRELDGTAFGADLYRHTLRLPTSCNIVQPPNEGYWIEVFNETGPAADWYWVSGFPDPSWPCCSGPGYGSVEASETPGSVWSPIGGPMAIETRTLFLGGTEQLRLDKVSGQIVLEWEPDCGGGDAYSVYRGQLSAGLASLAPEPGLCDVTDTSATVDVGEGTADFFIVAPRKVLGGSGQPSPLQGSYGVDSSGAPRPQPAQRCHDQATELHDCAL